MLEGLRKPTELIVVVVTLLAYGCPIQAIVHAFGLDERTVASWRDRAGKHCQQVHQALVPQGQLDAHHVQVDEIRVKGTPDDRLDGAGHDGFDPSMVGRSGESCIGIGSWQIGLLPQVRACCRPLQAILVCTDGWAAYPGSIRRAFREKVKRTAGRGRACLQVWPRAVYRYRHQAHGEETGRRSDTENDAGNAGTSEYLVASLIGWHRAHYGLY